VDSTVLAVRAVKTAYELAAAEETGKILTTS
jgi:Xaa-Pro aminopeptidase